MAKLNDILKAGIEEYTGRFVKRLHTYEDGVGAIGLRAEMIDDGDMPVLDFLVANFDVAKCKDAVSTVGYLEETEWETWPPQEGAPRFL